MLLVFLTVVVTLLLLISIKNVLTKNINYWKDRGVKYVKPLLLFGNMLPTVTKSMHSSQLIQYLYRMFPEERYVGIFQFFTPVLLIRDPELIKTVTIKKFENFSDHAGGASYDVDRLWSKNIFASKGERWRDLRQTLSPVFTSSKMRSMFVLMEECAKDLIDYFKKNNDNLLEVELKDVFSRYTNDIIASAAFGIKCNSLESKENDFLMAGRELTNFTGLKRFSLLLLGSYPRFAKLFNIRIVNERVGNFFKSVIDETIRLRESKNIIRPDVIHLLMAMRNGKLKYEDYLNLPEAGFATALESTLGKNDGTPAFLTNEDITAQAIVFFFGGFDTSSILMCFAGYELAVNPQIQKKLKEEIINTSLKNNGKITYESLLNMRYLDMVISETLRKWPPAIWIERVCTKPFEIKPETKNEPALKINVGDFCMIPVFAIHRDPKYYPDPDTFNPERFNEENKDKIQTATYLPFGSGPRNCIGSRFALLETKILLYHILLDYDFVPTQKTQIPLKLDKGNLMLIAENGFHVGLKRNKNAD